jgi:DNA polymerase III delta prime subunit
MKNFLWVEKYRPTTISDTILPTSLKDTFMNMLKAGELQNMLFTGTAGLGKTTVAKALCKQLNLDYIVINGSEEGNIDTLRGKIKQFASTVSLAGGKKVIILDEADYLNAQSTQPALRGFIEQFSDNCRFILTCNFMCSTKVFKMESQFCFNGANRCLGTGIRLCSIFTLKSLTYILSNSISLLSLLTVSNYKSSFCSSLSSSMFSSTPAKSSAAAALSLASLLVLVVFSI